MAPFDVHQPAERSVPMPPPSPPPPVVSQRIRERRQQIRRAAERAAQREAESVPRQQDVVEEVDMDISSSSSVIILQFRTFRKWGTNLWNSLYTIKRGMLPTFPLMALQYFLWGELGAFCKVKIFHQAKLWSQTIFYNVAICVTILMVLLPFHRTMTFCTLAQSKQSNEKSPRIFLPQTRTSIHKW